MANTKTGAWNAVVSAIADPALRKFAERLASSISEDSWLRSEFAERLLAGLKGLAEGYKGSGVSGIAVEKATDFLDFASGNLFTKKKGSAAGTAQGWLGRFVRDAEKALREAPRGELEEIRTKLLREFEIRQEIAHLVEQAEKESQPPAPPKAAVDLKRVDVAVATFIRKNRPGWLRRRPRREKIGEESDESDME